MKELLFDNNGLLLSEREVPDLPEASFAPAPDEDRDALLVDLDYRLTLVELGVI